MINTVLSLFMLIQSNNFDMNVYQIEIDGIIYEYAATSDNLPDSYIIDINNNVVYISEVYWYDK